MHGALASILLLDDDGLHLRHGAAASLPTATAKQWTDSRSAPRRRRARDAWASARAVIVTDIATDPLWQASQGWRDGMACAPAGPPLAKDDRLLGAYRHLPSTAPGAGHGGSAGDRGAQPDRGHRDRGQAGGTPGAPAGRGAEPPSEEYARDSSVPGHADPAQERLARAFRGRSAAGWLRSPRRTRSPNDGWTGRSCELIREQLAAWRSG